MQVGEKGTRARDEDMTLLIDRERPRIHLIIELDHLIESRDMRWEQGNQSSSFLEDINCLTSGEKDEEFNS